MENTMTSDSLNFIEQIVDSDLKSGKHASVITRFPPEPNGYLHIGHVSAIFLNFSIAEKFGGKTNLRFDDTNPVKEDTEFVDSIINDIKWLGYKWDGEPLYASNYFDNLYEFAIQLIKEGKAFVDDCPVDQMREMRGVPTKPGTDSPFKTRTIEENLDLFQRMQAGEFEEGSRVLRAIIDMSSPNMHMRDPIMYRILKAHHHRTGDKWNIYPMYDFAHGISDSIENITHSLCTLEFEVHRPVYEWFNRELRIYEPLQIERSRINLNYTVVSKRKLLALVDGGFVTGWDDPRMPTISGMRRRGYTPESLKNFVIKAGISRRPSNIDISLLEFCVREDLNKKTARVMAVLNPLKVQLTNYPDDQVEQMESINNPEDPDGGSRTIPFSKHLLIEKEDFLEDAPKKFFRLAPGRMVRLKSGYIIQCDDFVKDPETGEVTELLCSYIPESRSGSDTSGLKVKGTIHWVSANHALEVEARLYDRLFKDPDPEAHKDEDGKSLDFINFVNEESLTKITAYVEPSLKTAKAGDQVQFMRKGYFCVDPDSTEDKLIFNRTVGLRDSWAKKQKK